MSYYNSMIEYRSFHSNGKNANITLGSKNRGHVILPRSICTIAPLVPPWESIGVLGPDAGVDAALFIGDGDPLPTLASLP